MAASRPSSQIAYDPKRGWYDKKTGERVRVKEGSVNRPPRAQRGRALLASRRLARGAATRLRPQG